MRSLITKLSLVIATLGVSVLTLIPGLASANNGFTVTPSSVASSTDNVTLHYTVINTTSVTNDRVTITIPTPLTFVSSDITGGTLAHVSGSYYATNLSTPIAVNDTKSFDVVVNTGTAGDVTLTATTSDNWTGTAGTGTTTLTLAPAATPTPTPTPTPSPTASPTPTAPPPAVDVSGAITPTDAMSVFTDTFIKVCIAMVALVPGLLAATWAIRLAASIMRGKS